jgi:hypothetical protein
MKDVVPARRPDRGAWNLPTGQSCDPFRISSSRPNKRVFHWNPIPALEPRRGCQFSFRLCTFSTEYAESERRTSDEGELGPPASPIRLLDLNCVKPFFVALCIGKRANYEKRRFYSREGRRRGWPSAVRYWFDAKVPSVTHTSRGTSALDCC